VDVTNIVKEKNKMLRKERRREVNFTPDIHGRLQSFERFSRFKYFC
jgi:hypothetical protein